jgi:3-oxoacyl-[acyl-carrier-protein] synthase II
MRVVITGMGIVSSIGNTIETFWENLMQGNNGLKKITRFDTKEYKSKLAGEITDFDPTLFMNQKSLFKYDRIQLFAIGAAHMAWENAGLDQSSYHSDELGVVLGSTYGYIDSVSSFYIESLKEGPAYVSPLSHLLIRS